MWISKKEAAGKLGISVKTLESLIKRGQLPAYRVGSRMVRLKDSDIEAYMNARMIAPTPPRKAKAAAPVARPCLYVPGMKVV